MKYSNPDIPDEINAPKRSPVKSFFTLLLMAAALGGIVIAVFSFGAQYLARLIPFEFETALASQFEIAVPESSREQQYLQSLANRLTAGADLPGGMTITVHYSDEDVVNAFATLGGHVIFYKELVEQLKSEQALAMVMAHEIAHVVNRDPVTALGRGVFTGIAVSSIFDSTNNALIQRLVSGGNALTELKFSRDDESRADEDGYGWVVQLYGNGCGAEQLFELFDSLQGGDDIDLPQIFTTHPYVSSRLQTIRQRQGDDCQANAEKLTPNPLFKTNHN